MVLKDVSDTVTAWTLYLLSVKFIFALFHINSFHFHLKTDLKINNKKKTPSPELQSNSKEEAISQEEESYK